MIRYIFAIIILSISSSALAFESVQFTNKELAAIFTLMRPELNSIELNGRKAVFTPSPSIKYLGVEASEIPLNLGGIANIVDLEFNHIKAKTPEIKFQNGSLTVSVPVEDQNRGIQSVLGSISFQNVVLNAQVGWTTLSNGSQEIILLGTDFQGDLKGTGVLRSKFILDNARKLLVNLLSNSINNFLKSEKLQNSVSAGLIQYGKFYSGIEVKDLLPGSIQFWNDGIKYNVE